jgi:hypothetical protein
MTTAEPRPPASSEPARTASVKTHQIRRHRGEGQWAKGHFTPLNANEQFKKDDDGLNVRARIENIYSVRGFDSIDGADLRGRMRWWGLYTQRRPGIDGGKTAVLEPEELDDKYFMLRVRIDGGRLTLAQLRAIATVSTDYARGTADVTDRQNIQLHWIRIEDVPAIWRILEGVGLSTTEACGDVPRVILGSPVAGVAKDEIIDGTSGDRARSTRGSSGPPSSRTCRASSRPRSPGCRTWCTRRTTSRSSGSSTRSTGPASTCGSAAACPPTRSSPSGSAPSCRWPRCRRCGPGSAGSSGTTGTAGCGPAPG